MDTPEKNEPAAAPATSEELARFAADVLAEMKGEDIVILRMDEVLPLTDYFVIATGKNVRHVDSLVELLEKRVKALKIPIRNRSGKDTNWWVLIDLGSVVVHVFRAEARDFYDLELLWGDAERV